MAEKTATASPVGTSTLAARYLAVRARTMELAAPLSAEDAMLQSMPEASPAKWHLAHTTWFFARFVLASADDRAAPDPVWESMFNSYYRATGPLRARAARGQLSRPSLRQVRDYRQRTDEAVMRLLRDAPQEQALRIELGLQHEQQHQELLLTDIKHAFAGQPLAPAYRDDLTVPASTASGLHWHRYEESIIEIGAPRWPGGAGFAYDNESPRHRVLVPGHALTHRPVSNAEYRAFVEDGGYRTPSLWLDAGWNEVEAGGWRRPLYWDEGLEREFTLGGWRAIDPHAPVVHLSHFEADAFARWAGARLPTEMEWERAAGGVDVAGNFADAGHLHPASACGPSAAAAFPGQLFGDVWEWTSSAYLPYPGFAEWAGAVGEYNGKFMSGQMVLRGGSCASAAGHLRASYRNFFPPAARWQFAGLRLARDL